ncbi:beta-ketoacyl synthase [Aurantivibrio plasticivorans]
MSNTRLPVIVGFGGFNAAGRSSGHQSYRRMILESLPSDQVADTVAGLATLTGMVEAIDGGKYSDGQGKEYTKEQVGEIYKEAIEAATLIRRVETSHFDPDATHWHKKMSMSAVGGSELTFEVSRKHLPEPIPSSWTLSEGEGGKVRVTLSEPLDIKIDSYRDFPVKSAGQLPTGFDPSAHYNSRFHPRGLQMTILGASDAVHSLGMPWEKIVDAVRPDEIGVYSGSVLSQMDEYSNAGLAQSRMKGARVSSKQLAMGMNTMPADFVNAYVLGSVGVTGSAVGACATFLYTLRQGIEDIQSGRRRVVMVGAAEAPVNPEFMEGFDAMSALASDANLKHLDGCDIPNYRRASRPFGENCGFVIGESAQYVVLMDDELAFELGADIYGAVPNVYINADGYKKSISAPGPGNYITFAKAVAATQAIIGEQAIKERSVVQAHGSSTPANRTSESLIFDRIAKAFGIEHWPVGAVKAYVGHTIGPASADQLIATLGLYQHGILPGIKTIDRVADDVHADRLAISNTDVDLSDNPPVVSFLNSKGFGGNNATASVLSASYTESMLAKRFGKKAYSEYANRREGTREVAQQYVEKANLGQLDAIYRFGEGMIDESEIQFGDQEMSIPSFKNSVSLDIPNPFDDMVE